jgi:predicted DCC family thiol-disulfide oxidoreductase YuxK
MVNQAAMGGVLPLTTLYDGGCPLCLREVRFLQGCDQEPHRLAFVDIDAPTYDPGRHAHGLIVLGWPYAPTGWHLVGPIVEAAYRLWARLRLPVTGRPGLEQLCQARQGGGTPAAAAEGRCRI